MMVKICGITNRDDALAAIEGGASALGFNFWPRSPRYLLPRAAAQLAALAPASVLKVGVFVDEPAAEVARLVREAGLDIAQLHGSETPAGLPVGVRLWKAVRIQGEIDLTAWDASSVEAVLVDGPSSGLTFDWATARPGSKPLIVAGGLDASNVREAVERLRPWGVDACSRLEAAPGIKDRVKMANFLKVALAC